MVVTLHLVGLSIDTLNINNKNKASPPSTTPSYLPKKPNSAHHKCPKRGALLYQLRNVTDHQGRTLLHLASSGETCSVSRNYRVRFPHNRIIRSLLYARFDPNAADSLGKRPLHYAAESFEKRPPLVALESFKALVRGGAHCDYRDIEGNTPLGILCATESSRSLVNPVRLLTLRCLTAHKVAQYVRDNPRVREHYHSKLGVTMTEVMKH